MNTFWGLQISGDAYALCRAHRYNRIQKSIVCKSSDSSILFANSHRIFLALIKRPNLPYFSSPNIHTAPGPVIAYRGAGSDDPT